MQTLKIDGTTYRVKFDRDPLELAKAARKPYRPKKPKDIRRFPVWQGKATPRQRRVTSANSTRSIIYSPSIITAQVNTAPLNMTLQPHYLR